MGKRPEGRTAFSDLLFPCLFSFWEEKSDPTQRGSERKSGVEIVFESLILTKYLFRQQFHPLRPVKNRISPVCAGDFRRSPSPTASVFYFSRMTPHSPAFRFYIRLTRWSRSRCLACSSPVEVR